ncbi:hypothetical protein PNK_0888 [Candidatus Protochlamydia naegleriophila]|uniref:Uncharacterized protein n=1 Tax=Candidatus Protochlamydia naegleriophila TaxID=389348 RepID=A0A0U5EQZ0_9BACT|nr:hypothetical protein [Candidatus Protochlamydia naegleriophila]CUI16513.1 hypothetical protein PNK_0888 [Candidatus Protochlamydia naegleriophila]
MRSKTTTDEQRVALHKFAHFLFGDLSEDPESRSGVGVQGDVISEDLDKLVDDELTNIQGKQGIFAPDKWKAKWNEVRQKMWSGV